MEARSQGGGSIKREQHPSHQTRIVIQATGEHVLRLGNLRNNAIYTTVDFLFPNIRTIGRAYRCPSASSVIRWDSGISAASPCADRG
jgi:hypothetical protein